MPIYDTVYEAMKDNKINTGIIYVPPARAKDAALEAIDLLSSLQRLRWFFDMSVQHTVQLFLSIKDYAPPTENKKLRDKR